MLALSEFMLPEKSNIEQDRHWYLGFGVLHGL
jgi:hypothetical protein